MQNGPPNNSVAALALGALVLALPAPADLAPAGQRMAALFLAALALWATEALPIGVTALAVLVAQPLLRVADLNTAFRTFMSPVFFFVLAMFCIAQVIIATGLDRRLALWLLARAGTDSRRVVLAFMIGTATVSTIMSDVPACAIFMALALGTLVKAGLRPGSPLGKALMLGVPVASLIGGVATPAGSSVNILGLHFIEQYGRVRVPFVSWMILGIPMVVALVPVAWWLLVRFYPPEVATIGSVEEIERERRALGPLRTPEKKALALLGAMIVLWVLGSWIEALEVPLVGLAGAVATFLPGIRLLTWSQAERGIGWDVLLLVGGVTSLGAASVETGLAKWIVDATLSGFATWPLTAAVAAISAFTVVVHLVLPVGPIINVALIPPIALLALSAGANPALYTLPVAFTASAAFLLPIEPVLLITYSKGYYRMFELLLPGTILSAAWVLLMTILVVTLHPLLGV